MKRAFAWALAVTAGLCGSMACTSILGIEDVRLRRDAGDIIEPNDGSSSGDGPITDGGGEGAPDAAPSVLQVTQGYRHTCARKPDGSVYCWGDNFYGQAGDGIPFDAGDGARPDILRPQRVPSLSNVASLAAGDNHTCARKSDGTVFCWGYNYYGQVGNGQNRNSVSTPTQVGGLNDALQVEGGAAFTCALRASGGIVCWGANYAGQLGNGNTGGDSPTPVPVAQITDAVAVAAGDSHACALRQGGAVSCWGNNFDGQIGNGQAGADVPTPTPVSGLVDAVAVLASGSSTCALRRGGGVSCWGYNRYGELGNGTSNTTPNPTPSNVAGLTDAVGLGGGFLHVCVLRTGGVVSCWGRGDDGQLGFGSQLADSGVPTSTPVQVSGLNNAVSIGLGAGDHNCATTATGALVCWGRNDNGQLGNGLTTNAYGPITVQGFP